MKKPNPVKKNMDKFHKPKTHRDKTKYTRKGKENRYALDRKKRATSNIKT